MLISRSEVVKIRKFYWFIIDISVLCFDQEYNIVYTNYAMRQ